MVKFFSVEMLDAGYLVVVVFQDGVQEKHVAGSLPKLKKLIKAILTTKEPNAN